MRVPFSAPSDPQEYIASASARVPCDSCGEWVYALRHVDGGPVFLPDDCPVCGNPVSRPTDFTSSEERGMAAAYDLVNDGEEER